MTSGGGAVGAPAGTMLSRLQELRREEETLLRVKAALHDQLRRLRVRGGSPGLRGAAWGGSGGAGPALSPARPRSVRDGPCAPAGLGEGAGDCSQWSGKGGSTYGALRGKCNCRVHLKEVNVIVCRVHLKEINVIVCVGHICKKYL